jgi:hypothetical protein
MPKAEIRRRLKDITGWRDKIHLDRFVPDDDLHFKLFEFRECYIPTYKTFRMVLTALNPDWPDNCCLNEELQDAPAVEGLPNGQ